MQEQQKKEPEWYTGHYFFKSTHSSGNKKDMLRLEPEQLAV
jgi:hypothetical protein